MAETTAKRWTRLRGQLAAYLVRPAVLACLPTVSLATYWLGGEKPLIALAVLLPLVYLLVGGSDSLRLGRMAQRDKVTGLMPRDCFDDVVEQTFICAREKGLMSAAFMIEIEDHDALLDRHGQAAVDLVVKRTGERLSMSLRDEDALTRCGDYRFAVCLAPVRHLDLELCIQLSGRFQAAVEEPISVDGTSVYVTVGVGFCQHTRVQRKSATKWIEAANLALREAQQNGPGSIRAFSDEIQRRSESRAELREEVITALEKGQIQPWFQPQISTDTGLVTGFEALARWQHPARGMISPADFLPAIEQAGKLERLAEVMMYHSFTALKAWDGAGYEIPQIGVNFAGPELNNPRLVEKVQWELDRFDLAPERLAVEVLETVVAGAPDDVVTRNINGLGALGCRIDLDDFGTGHASIASIRRFSVSRIKIDRSFVIKSDRDPEQQRMISAILTMAERLGVETLAEGVETVGEHALLAQLGCDHVQGYGIAKPMPFDQTLDWISAHNAKLQDAPQIMGKKAK